MTMVARAQAHYIRISAQKARLVVPLLKGKRVAYALQVLPSINKKIAPYFMRLIQSAVNNARNKGFVDSADLFIARLIVNEGPALKRHRAASFGRAMSIRKRTSHIAVELDAYTVKGK